MISLTVPGLPVAQPRQRHALIAGFVRNYTPKAAPVNAFTLWKSDAVQVKSGSEHVATFEKTPFSQRKYCKLCGGHLTAGHQPVGLVDVYAATIPTLKFVPGVHVNYAESVLPMKDGLPKLKDFPAELGGSGIMVPE